ncbi:MAG: geranylgeranylglycerol-phosphate geranylgeranyltransferase [Bacteroidota bacterium]
MTPPLIRNFIGYVKASRIPNLLIIVATQVLTAKFLLHEVIWFDLDFFLVVISTAMIAAGGYLINDYYDQKIDMVNRPQKVVVGTEISRRPALLSHTLTNLAAVAIGFWVDVWVGLIHIFSSFLLWYYSNHLRRLPLVGNLSIGLLSAMTFLILLVFYRADEPIVFFYALFGFLMVVIREVIKDIQDVKGEAAFGCVTVPVIWGIRGAKTLIIAILIAGSALLVNFLLLQSNWPLRLYFLALAPFFLWFLYKLTKADTNREFRTLNKFCSYIIFTGLISLTLN